MLFFWHTSPFKTFADLLGRPATIAISSVNEAPAYRLNAMNRFLGTRLKPIAGYPAARDYVLAAERGETDGGTSTFIGLSQLFANYLTDGRLRIPVQFATARDPAMPEVPTVVELARDGEGEQVFRYLVANDEIGRSLFATPNVPAGAACAAPRGVCGDARRCGIQRRGGTAAASARASKRRGDGKAGRGHVRHFAGRDGEDQGDGEVGMGVLLRLGLEQ